MTPSTPMDADTLGAFVPGPRHEIEPTGHGPLDGLRLAVKDLIDVQGDITGGGNPDWAAGQTPAQRHSPAVAACLAAGATLVGKTITDELAFSLEGENAHHGTPLNPRAPDRLPGGSSSGSASAVAGGTADIALGTDTGGSVRIPASFCGLFGMRPTHGRISLQGVVPFAPSLDTVGWFARDAVTLRRMGQVLLKGSTEADTSAPPPLVMLDEAWALADVNIVEALTPIAQAWASDHRSDVFDTSMADWLRAYQVLQGAEIREQLGPWIQATQPRFGPAIAPRFASVFTLDNVEINPWQAWRTRHVHRIHTLMARQPQVWVMPTSPVAPLKRDAGGEQRGDFYQRTLALCALAGMAGLPQITLPLATLADGPPIGLSLIGAHGTDLPLLDLAVRLTSR
ncbi:MAG: amidase [Pseudomonadota bacterium]